ncbi:MAG: GRP family sugar transporter [Lachnospiraceae bacterium]|nr:GRP family sugar transporter [Lachnospiraceae bacterium]MDD7701972.1 GRP family sugar transporter [Lachnospiraceae bacterium]MDY3301870.1 GRP family sugar transporter [Lachnospiraceae bacterium]
MTAILIGLIPAMLWGILPLILHYTKSNSWIQLKGTAQGNALVAILVLLFLNPPTMSAPALVLSFLSGFAWPIGMYGQFECYKRLGVARTFPISAGLQIVGNALLGWLILGEWKSGRQIGLGMLGVLIILLGIVVSNVVFPLVKKEEEKTDKKAVLLLVLTTAGYWLYSLLPKLIVDGNPMSEFAPQALGIWFSVDLLVYVVGRQKRRDVMNRDGLVMTAVGTLYGFANIAFLYSISLNGMVKGFLLGQINMIIATLLGICILKERPKVGLLKTCIGLVMIAVGCITIQMI